MKSDKNFKFYLPVDFIKKGKDKAGNDIMRIKGVASTLDEDLDGQVLNPNGFDLDYFMNNGFLNWHHMGTKDPQALIGEPTKAEIINNELHIEGILYPFSETAKKVYELAEQLQNSPSKRRLGFSIEGKTIEEDPLNKNYIKKAKITGMAITPMPKNPSTFLDIMKGCGVEVEEFETVSTSSVNGGSVEYLLDVKKSNGDNIKVDKNFNILIEKALSTSGSGSVLKRESLEGSPKKLITKENFDMLCKSEKAGPLLIIFDAYKKNQISKEVFEKAFIKALNN